MKRNVILMLAFLASAVSLHVNAQTKPDTLWFQFDDPFTENEIISLTDVDSIIFGKSSFSRFRTIPSTGNVVKLNKSYRKDGVYRMDKLERTLIKPSAYSSVDFTKESSQWCFQRSMESEHFVCFWEDGLTLSKSNTISYNGYTVNVKTLLDNGEKIWKKYVEELGFLEPGKSTTDEHKICMFIVKTSWNGEAWRADGSGTDGTVWYYEGTKKSKPYKVGLFHCTPWAAGAEGGHTAAHEIGHVFQYLVSADLGTNHGWQWGYGDGGSGGCAWWESCAQWQAFQVFPAGLFSGYYGTYLSRSYLNLLHEGYEGSLFRYANYFIQYYWCQLHGQDFIGKMWRETKRPEDPVETYKRMTGATQSDFNKMMFDYACRVTTWDIDGIRDRGKNYQNAFSTKLTYVEGTDNTYAVNAENCPQNYGFNIIPLKGFQGGTTVKVNFKGIAGADGYRKINVGKAGWRYGFVAQTTDGERVYGDMYSDKEGVAEMALPENTKRAWLVVTGAPIEHWRHPWDDSDATDEQWPYQVAFENCAALGTTRTYGDYADDYERKDTTVVLYADLVYSASQYTSVRVQYDMDAISQALGVSTAQMKAVKRNTSAGTKGTLVFAGVSKSGNKNFNTTTSTSSSTCYGHWFTTAGNVVGYDNSAAIFAEMYPDQYGCYVGQYPGRLSKGKTYIIRQAFVYTHTDGKQYTATMEVHLSVN